MIMNIYAEAKKPAGEVIQLHSKHVISNVCEKCYPFNGKREEKPSNIPHRSESSLWGLWAVKMAGIEPLNQREPSRNSVQSYAESWKLKRNSILWRLSSCSRLNALAITERPANQLNQAYQYTRHSYRISHQHCKFRVPYIKNDNYHLITLNYTTWRSMWDIRWRYSILLKELKFVTCAVVLKKLLLPAGKARRTAKQKSHIPSDA